MQRFLIPALVAAALLVGHAIVQGILTERWQHREVNESQQAFAARLKEVPFEFGDWKSIDSHIDKRQLDASRAVGSYSRRFQKQSDPEKIVEVFLVCGHPADMTQHTPDQCYPLNGNAEIDEQSHYIVDTGKSSAEFWTNRYRKSGSIENAHQVRVFWSFTTDGKWQAPTAAKYWLRGLPALYKVYAITEIRGETRSRPEESAAVAFLRDFIPMINGVLFPPESSSTAPAETATARAASPFAADPAENSAR